MERILLIRKVNEKIKAMTNYKKTLHCNRDSLNCVIKDYANILRCLKKGGDLNDLQKITSWNYSAYFKMNFETFVLGKSLRDLLNENGAQIENINGLCDIDILVNNNYIKF